MNCLIVRMECITNPLWGGCSFDEHAIETAGGVGLALGSKEVLCRKDDSALLLDGDAGRSTPEMAVSALANLDENQGLAVTAHQIDLAAAAAVVARDDAQALAFEVARRGLFGLASACARGIVFAHRSWICHDGRDSRIVCRADPAR